MHAVGQHRCDARRFAHREGVLGVPSRLPHPRGPSTEPVRRVRPSSASTDQIKLVCAACWMARTRRPARSLTVLSKEPVMMRPSGRRRDSLQHSVVISERLDRPKASPSRICATSLQHQTTHGMSAPLQRCRGRALAGKARGPGRPPAAGRGAQAPPPRAPLPAPRGLLASPPTPRELATLAARAAARRRCCELRLLLRRRGAISSARELRRLLSIGAGHEHRLRHERRPGPSATAGTAASGMLHRLSLQERQVPQEQQDALGGRC